MELDEKTTNKIVEVVEKDIPKLAKKIDKIYDLLVGTDEMPELGLIPRVNAIEESLKDLGMLTKNLTAIPDIAKRLLELEITVLGVKRDGTGGMSAKLDFIQKKPEKTMRLWLKVMAIIGGTLGILTTIINGIIFLMSLP